VATDDLSSITGLEDRHRRALAKRQITTLRSLAGADQRVIYSATGSIRPRPTLKQIARWQGEARGKLGEPATDAAQWHTAPSFAVVFARRRAGDTWERRLEVERTEVEPEREPEVWADWECDRICGWMLGQLGEVSGAGPGPGAPAGESRAQLAGAQLAGAQLAGAQLAGEPARPAERAAGQARLHVDSAAIIDATGHADLVTDGVLVADPPTELVAPVRVVFTVSGARPGTEVHAVARLRGQGRPGKNAQDPAVVPPSGRTGFGLSGITAGRVELALLAWAPDASARPVSVRLPAVTIR
jgi:hypothetical protein